MKIGIRAHDVDKNTPECLFNKIKSLGFDYIQLVFKKTLIDDKGEIISFNEDNIYQVKSSLQKNHLNVAMLGAYFNPVHSNKVFLNNNIEYFKEHLRLAKLLDCEFVGTETGSYNDDKWTYNPKNQTEIGYQETMKVFHELVDYAEKVNTTILMEPAYGHVIYSVDQLKRTYDELNSPNLKVTIDIFNLLYIGNYQNYQAIFLKAVQTFKDEIIIFHLKDFKVVDGKIVQCGLGKGIIDFDFIITNIKKYAPNSTLIFEGVVGEDIITSLKLIKEKI